MNRGRSGWGPTPETDSTGNRLKSWAVATTLRLVSFVEAEDTLRESVCRALRLENLRAEGHRDGAAALESFDLALPDLGIVDLAVTDAVAVCRRLREGAPARPLIAVIARGQHVDDTLEQSVAGDDYLPKPFSLKELLPRVQHLLRRASLTGHETLAWEDRPLTLGSLTVDPLRLAAQWGGKGLSLTVTEFFILHSLVRRAGVVKTRDQLLQDAFPGRSADEGIVERLIARIRSRFERLEPEFDALEGVHGAGYRYRTGPAVRRK